jgi:hypothetical protein
MNSPITSSLDGGSNGSGRGRHLSKMNQHIKVTEVSDRNRRQLLRGALNVQQLL